MSLQLRLKRSDRVYRPGETVSGMVVCTSERGAPMGHNGITLKITGTVSMQLSPKNVGLFEAFYASIKPIELMVFNIDVAPAGKLPEGTTELPFEFQMTPVKGQRLFETYHGVYVNIEYRIDCDMPRPRMQKNLRQNLEFMVEIPDAGKPKGALGEKVEFTIDPSSLQNVGKKLQESIASFKIYGYLDSSAFKITDCFSGMIVVEESQAEIESIDMQLTRVESCGSSEAGGQCAKEATEIQSLQLVHGDPCRGMPPSPAPPLGQSSVCHLSPLGGWLLCCRASDTDLHDLPETLHVPDRHSPNGMDVPAVLFERAPGMHCGGLTSSGLLAGCLLFSCVVQFKIQFEVNLIVQFCDGYQITENFPIQIYR